MYGRRSTGKKKKIIKIKLFHLLQYGLSSSRESFDFRKTTILNSSSDLKKKLNSDGEDVEDEEDTEIAEDDVGEDEDSDEMQEENG